MSPGLHLHTRSADIPVVVDLPGWSMVDVFNRLRQLPHCIWFDSATPGPQLQPGGDCVGRYSFLTADPVVTLEAFSGDPDPWPTLRRWSAALESLKNVDRRNDAAGLPFQGGMAGLWGYEAAVWLDGALRFSESDDTTKLIPLVSIGLYDWAIVHDHTDATTWLVSQGFADDRFERDPQLARHRADWVLSRLRAPVSDGDRQDARTSHPIEVRTQSPASRFSTHWDSVHSNFDPGDGPESFRAGVREIIESIRRGDSFQVNLAQTLTAPLEEASHLLYLRLRDRNPAPLAGFYDGGSFQVLSSSPEGFLRLRDRVVQTRPIKGTAARTGDEEMDLRLAAALLESEKDRAENVMIVDLMRNDLSRVCVDESVDVKKLCGIEVYAHVQHLVSVVEGKLRDGMHAIDLLAACFPGGSVTGAPKIEAMRTIARLEPESRGPYCGSLGYVSLGGDAEFNILIRTITAAAGWLRVPVGGGITAQSDPEAEQRETWVKAEGMLRAVVRSMIQS